MVGWRDPAALRWLIGVELRRLRLQAGVTCVLAAEEIRCTPGKMTHIEMGKYFPREEDIERLGALYGAAEEDVDRLTSLTARADSKAWWLPLKDVAPEWLRTFLGLEGIASHEFTYIPLVLPGLLQTERYAEAVTGAGEEVPRVDIRRIVRLRMQRQQRLLLEHMRLTTVIEESVLDRPMGDDEVMREQWKHLVSLSSRSHVDIRVLPTSVGAHAGLMGGFTVLDFVEANSIGYVEIPGDAVYVHDLDRVEYFHHIREELLSNALPPVESSHAIEARLAD